MKRFWVGPQTALRYGIVGLLLVALLPHAAGAAANPLPTAKISFTFDDGLASAYTQAQPTLAQYGLTGTDYVITGCVGMTTTPNSCRANQGLPYMTWAQIQSLQQNGWEIGSHSVDHQCLASNAAADPGDCQRNTLTTAQIDTELSQSKSDLAAHGITATDFSAPYGDYNNTVLAQVAKYYATMRGFKDENDNVWPYNEYLLNNVAVQETIDTPAVIKTKIDQAIAAKRYLVLTFHDIAANPSQNPDDYQYGTSELAQIAAYVKAKQDAGLLQAVTVDQAMVTSGDTMLTNGNFANGIASGWATDNSTVFTKDSANNGSFPEAVNAIKIAASAAGANAHLFSPKVAVDPYTTYLFKNFLNVQAIASGQVAFYVDEYDANGNWISGQYLEDEDTAFVENLNFTYTPSSPAVSKASLQVIAAGSSLTAYLDNAQLFALSTAARANLVPNGTFDSGIASGWNTDASAAIKADAANHGSPANPVHSVSLTAASTNVHLFSPKVLINGGTYNVTAYLNLQALTSNELGLYMDEYDAGGNWISGKYVNGIHVTGAGNVGFVYTPTSATVSSASLQVIVVGNSDTTAYFDDVKWYKN